MKTRKEAVEMLDEIVELFVNDRCIGTEGEEVRAEFAEALAALGVTPEELEEWT